jgi:beta-lactamase class A
MNRRLLLSLALAICALTPTRARAEGLSERLMPLIQAHKGKVAVAVKHLDTGEEFYFHADEAMPTASLIKTAVMVETYRQAGEKRVDLGEMLTVRAEDRVPGSGILTQLSPGLSLSLRDAVRLMIALSDNTATNLVLDKIGLPATAATMEKLGYPETKIHSKVFKRDTSVFPERSKQFGLGSTTARESVRLLEAIHKKQLVSPEACEAMLGHLRACQDADKFPRFLPEGVRVAFKSGSVKASRTAAGILYTSSGPVALCVLTNENEDQRWVPDNAGDRLCAEVAREVALHFTKRPEPNP